VRTQGGEAALPFCFCQRFSTSRGKYWQEHPDRKLDESRSIVVVSCAGVYLWGQESIIPFGPLEPLGGRFWPLMEMHPAEHTQSVKSRF
jgi:hypothetical protein